MTTTVEPMTLRKHPTFPWRLSLSWSSWEERTALEGGRKGREGVGEGRRDREEGSGREWPRGGGNGRKGVGGR